MKNCMQTEVNSTEIENSILLNFANPKDRFMNEHIHHDGENFITFNIVEINTVKSEILVAVSNIGHINPKAFDLFLSSKGYYFEYGIMLDKIYLDNFINMEVL